jgi:hypothetical protein
MAKEMRGQRYKLGKRRLTLGTKHFIRLPNPITSEILKKAILTVRPTFP